MHKPLKLKGVFAMESEVSEIRNQGFTLPGRVERTPLGRFQSL
jgi:hypothetical protein